MKSVTRVRLLDAKDTNTHVVIEEVGEVQEKGVRVLNTRKNRFLNKEYGIVGKTVMTCNPTQNFIKRMFYEVYKALGMGRFQKWEHGQVELPDGRMVTAFRAFVKSLVSDNPFISRNYIETLNQAPAAERKRLRGGDWDVDEADYMLFPTRARPRAQIERHGWASRAGRRCRWWQGSTRAGVMDDGVLTEIIEIPVDPTSTVDTAEQTALGIIKVAQPAGHAPGTIFHERYLKRIASLEKQMHDIKTSTTGQAHARLEQNGRAVVQRITCLQFVRGVVADAVVVALFLLLAPRQAALVVSEQCRSAATPRRRERSRLLVRSNAKSSPGLADKPQRRSRARDDPGVAPFVVRTGVIWSGRSRL